MPNTLSRDQVEFYRRQGYLFPLPCLAPGETAEMRASLETFEREEGFSAGSIHFKGHLCFRWSWELARNTALLDAVEDLIGPDILVFHTTTWWKEQRTTNFVPWHQDGTYFGLEPYEHVTAWVALTPSTPERGCVQVIPGSHTIGQRPHFDQQDPAAMLSRGQTAARSASS